MSVVRSILLLATVASAVLAPMFIGHALANHENVWIVYGLAMLAVAAVLGLLATRGGAHRGDARRAAHP